MQQSVRAAMAATIVVLLAAGGARAQEAGSGYADVNGVHMYYEVRGEGTPLVVLHGAFMSIDSMGPVVERLAEGRRVYALELQGHGRTPDIDRPLGYPALADDVAAFIEETGIGPADVFGYSMGGGVALELAIARPDLVHKPVIAAASYRLDGIYPEVMEGIQQISPEAFAGSPWEAEYLRLAPNPEDWPALIEKVKQLDGTMEDWPDEAVAGIAAPTLLIVGDSDIVAPEHAATMFRLLGGGVPADMTGVLPDDRLAILPGTTHITVIMQDDLLMAIIPPFLDAPMPGAE